MNELKVAQQGALMLWLEQNGIDKPADILGRLDSLLGREKVSRVAVEKRLNESMKHHAQAMVQVLDAVVDARAAEGRGDLAARPGGADPEPDEGSRAPSPPSHEAEQDTAAQVGPETPAAPETAAAGGPGTPRPSLGPVVSAGGTEGVLADHTDPERLQALLDEFSPMDFSGEEQEPVQLLCRTTPRGIELRWKRPEDGAYRVYRLVSSDAGVPQTPEAGDTVVVTLGGSFVDTRPLVTAVRNYQLWVNLGPDLETAQWEQPAEVARVSVVAPPQNIVIKTETIRTGDAGGRTAHNVIAQWTLLSGAVGVQVYRVPRLQERVAGAANPSYRVRSDDPCVGGFVDPDVEVGDYVYQLVAEANVDGLTQLGKLEKREHSVLPVREVIEDLICVDTGDATFDLSWSTPSAGRTVVFRTPVQPMSGTLGQEHPEEMLSHFGLPTDQVLVHPIAADGARSRMVNVGLPDGWPRAYFTPVHVIGGQARIGRTELRVRTLPVVGAKIHQRVTRQIVTFGWPPAPDGDADDSQASGVNVYEAAPGTPPAAALSGTPIATASKASYDADGGIVLPRPLRPEGSVVYLVPYSYAGRQAVPGPPTMVQYPGLLRISYQVKSGWRIRRRKLEVSITADRAMAQAPGFVLIHNPDRLPLSIADGEALPMSAEGAELAEPRVVFRPSALTVEPSGESWSCEVDRPGYVRLFADLKPAQRAAVAVLDPPVKALQCMV